MSLEPWEVNLRRQLENQKPIEESVIKPVKAEENNIVPIVLLIIIAALTLIIYDFKNDKKIQTWFKSFSASVVPERIKTVEKAAPSPKNYGQDIDSLRSEIEKISIENKEGFKKLSDRIKANSDRINLTGILLNENFHIVRNNLDKKHLVFFNSDWTLNKMPRYISISDKDKEYLNKFVKTSQ